MRCSDPRSSLLVIALISSSGFGGCSSHECESGVIEAQPGTPLSARLETNPPANLPPDFGYSADVLLNAVAGRWTDSQAGVGLILTPRTLTYTIASDGAKCSTGANLSVDATLVTRGDSEAVALRGGFWPPSVEVIDGGILTLQDAEITETNHWHFCNLYYHAATASSDDELAGQCTCSSLGLAQGAVSLHR
jgi:hypothetical protein